tara:strand:+ start:65 stop:223 length:159 start_codon:yes stop_codon:yes gene_type:complete
MRILEMNQEEIVQLIKNLVEELDGTMEKSLRCNSYGRQSRIITIEYNVKETK